MRFLSLLLLFISTTTILFSSEKLITPMPNVKYDKDIAKLGEKLFFDTKLSYNDTISCASCHNLADGGDDNLKVSRGVDGKTGVRNAESVYNSIFNSFQFWDGRAKTLEHQALMPIENPVEMNFSVDKVLQKLKKDESYVKEFTKVFEDGITKNNLAKAIAEFEKRLITPNSRFDKYLQGDKEALSSDEINGFNKFKEYGCISCHNGVNIGGNIFQKIGIMKEYKTNDYGRYNITKNEMDRYYFKVPSLRNVELTAPYFHDGSVKTLKEAVNIMTEYQIGFELPKQDLENIIKFLRTLTGELPKVTNYE